jgi:hypothetical protein
MSEITSSRFSQSTENNSKNKKYSIASSQLNFIPNEFTPKDEYQNYMYIKKEKNINLTKLELLKNRINNLKQQEQKSMRQIALLQEKEEKKKNIIKLKNENKKMVEQHRKKELDRFMLIKKKIQEVRQAEINNMNNSILKRIENLNKKAIKIKKSKNDIKNRINLNNNIILNKNRMKYERAKTSSIFHKDKNMIMQAEKEELKRKKRIEMINKEKRQNVSLEKRIELLEQEEEKYLSLIKQSKLIKQKLKYSLTNNNIMGKSLINKSVDNFSNDNKIKENSKKYKFKKLNTKDNYKVKNIKMNVNNNDRRMLHNSLDLSFIDNYYNKMNKLYNNQKNEKNLFYQKLMEKNVSKSCSNKIWKNENISFEKRKEKDYSNIL